MPDGGPRDLSALRPAWLTVDLDALRANLELLGHRLRPAQRMAVVKANAYGHGAAEVSRALAEGGVEWLAVALVEEGAEVRRAGVTTPILVLGPVQPSQVPLVRKFGLVPAVSSASQLAMWREALAGAPAPLDLHLKVDTGMTRLGMPPEDLPEALAAVRRSPHLRLSGLMSHLAEADDLASPRTPAQEARFAAVLELLTAQERSRVLTHIANSAAALHRPLAGHHLVRLGLALYGADPARRTEGLRPVLSASARIVQLREVPAGTRAGYGGRWLASRTSRLAVLPVGYADGYSWRLGMGAEALVAGRRVPLAGAVSMDMLLLDVTDVPAAEGDVAVLLGRQGEEEITLHELADRAGTVPYELLCLLGQRLPRRYRSGGSWVALRSRLMGGPR